jgi:hypothetical protein
MLKVGDRVRFRWPLYGLTKASPGLAILDRVGRTYVVEELLLNGSVKLEEFNMWWFPPTSLKPVVRVKMGREET